MENIKLPTQKALDNGYEKRFESEYNSLLDRYNKLRKMIIKYDAGKLDFTPSCPIALLKKQLAAMGEYLTILEIRIEVEGLDV